MGLPEPHLVAQQFFRQPQVLQLAQELVQGMMLVIKATEVLQRVAQGSVGRTRASVQGNQRKGQNPQAFPLHNEGARLEQPHARVVLVLAFFLHRGEALLADVLAPRL